MTWQSRVLETARVLRTEPNYDERPTEAAARRDAAAILERLADETLVEKSYGMEYDSYIYGTRYFMPTVYRAAVAGEEKHG